MEFKTNVMRILDKSKMHIRAIAMKTPVQLAAQKLRRRSGKTRSRCSKRW